MMDTISTLMHGSICYVIYFCVSKHKRNTSENLENYSLNFFLIIFDLSNR